MKRLCFVFVVLMVSLMASNASAVISWLGTNVTGNWSDGTKWSGGIAPISTTDEVQISNGGIVNMDCSATIGLLHIGDTGTTGTGTLNLTAAAGFSGQTLTVNKNSDNLIIVGYANLGTIYQDTGTVKAYRSDGATTGAINIRYNNTTTSSYYLSGGLIDTYGLRGGFTGANDGFKDTGGEVDLRWCLWRLGAYGTVFDWTQGGSKLSPGGGGSIMTAQIGQSGYETRWITTAGSKVEIELASDSSYDKIRGSGNADLTLGILDIAAGYTPAPNSFFDVIKLDLKDTTKEGTGTFSSITDNLPGYFTGLWLDLDSSGKKETFRITYVPEPATIALLGLGSLIAVRKRKK
jgi:hypothetical protein